MTVTGNEHEPKSLTSQRRVHIGNRVRVSNAFVLHMASSHQQPSPMQSSVAVACQRGTLKKHFEIVLDLHEVWG